MIVAAGILELKRVKMRSLRNWLVGRIIGRLSRQVFALNVVIADDGELAFCELAVSARAFPNLLVRRIIHELAKSDCRFSSAADVCPTSHSVSSIVFVY